MSGNGPIKAALWAVDFIDGKCTLIRFIWRDDRDKYVNTHKSAHVVHDIWEMSASGGLQDVSRTKRV